MFLEIIFNLSLFKHLMKQAFEIESDFKLFIPTPQSKTGAAICMEKGQHFIVIIECSLDCETGTIVSPRILYIDGSKYTPNTILNVTDWKNLISRT